MTVMDIATAILAFFALVTSLWVYYSRRRRWQELRELERARRAECAVLKVARKFLRLELLAGGRGKHHAYHVSYNGVLLSVDAVDYYFAVLAGMHDFWQAVATAGGTGRNSFAISLGEIDLGDGKGDFTYVDNCCGKAFVDGIVPTELLHPYDCARATAEDFKNAVVECQAEASKRNRRRYSMAIQD